MARNTASISLIGDEATKAQLRRVVTLVNGEAVQDAILPAAELVRDIARRLVNVGKRTTERAHLRDAIFAVKGKRAKGAMADLAQAINGPAGPSVICGVSAKRAPHAHLVEFGHAMKDHAGKVVSGPRTKDGKVEKRPFLRPAADAARPLVRSLIESGLRKLLAPFST